ncbi:MAG: hypothetical protein CTY29_12030 [Methylobacter sp.]|nr:MAG: hypothetical protein CTY29_12030 [Methylobacter sp.]
MQNTKPPIDNQPDQHEQLDANGWPIGFFEKTAGCFQGEPLVREPQGDYELRLELDDSQPWDDTAYLLVTTANTDRLNQATAEIENQTPIQ